MADNYLFDASVFFLHIKYYVSPAALLAWMTTASLITVWLLKKIRYFYNTWTNQQYYLCIVMFNKYAQHFDFVIQNPVQHHGMFKCVHWALAPWSYNGKNPRHPTDKWRWVITWQNFNSTIINTILVASYDFFKFNCQVYSRFVLL